MGAMTDEEEVVAAGAVALYRRCDAPERRVLTAFMEFCVLGRMNGSLLVNAPSNPKHTPEVQLHGGRLMPAVVQHGQPWLGSRAN